MVIGADSNGSNRAAELAAAFAPMARAAGVQVPDAVAFSPPVIFVGGEKSRPVPQKYVPAVVDALRGRKLLFRRGGEVVFWSATEERFKPMKPHGLVSWLPSANGGGAVLLKMSQPEVDGDGARTGKVIQVPGDLSANMAQIILGAEDFLASLPEVVNMNRVSLPVMDEELKDVRGNALMRLCPKGYDERSKTWTMGDVEYDREMDVRDGVMWLDDLTRHFAWRNHSRDFAIWLAGLVTMFGRGCFGGRAPAFFVNANIQESGKTLLTWLITWAVHGTQSVKTLLPDAEEELTKYLDSVARMRMQYVNFDNIDWNGKEVKTALLDVFIAGDTHEIRKMATQEVEQHLNRTMVLGSGNNITVSADLRRRSLMADLWNPMAGTERQLPKDVKVIDADFWADVTNRQMMLGACWSMLRSWDEAGRQKKPGRLLGSFESWARMAPAVVWHVGKIFQKEWDCMAESGNEEIGDKKSRDYQRLAQTSVEEHRYDAGGKERRSFEVLVKEFAGIARRRGLEEVQKCLWPETSIEAVMACKDFRPPQKSASTEPVEDLEMWDDEAEGPKMDPETVRAASEYMGSKAMVALGIALKKQLNQRHFRLEDGSVWSFANMAGTNPRRFAVEKVKDEEG
jgi:hypothetical protein